MGWQEGGGGAASAGAGRQAGVGCERRGAKWKRRSKIVYGAEQMQKEGE